MQIYTTSDAGLNRFFGSGIYGLVGMGWDFQQSSAYLVYSLFRIFLSSILMNYSWGLWQHSFRVWFGLCAVLQEGEYLHYLYFWFILL